MHRKLVGVVVGLALGLWFGLSAAGAADAPKAPLDGLTFEVESKDPQGKSETDTLIFVDGTFESTSCRQYGFGPVAYFAEASGPLVAFRAEAKSEKEGTLIWNATVIQYQISGTMDWKKEGQADIRYTFDGKQVTVPK